MKCQKCGKLLNANNQFCTECGFKQLPSLPKVVSVVFSIMVLIYVTLYYCFGEMRWPNEVFKYIGDLQWDSLMISTWCFVLLLTCVSIVPTKIVILSVSLSEIFFACIYLFYPREESGNGMYYDILAVLLVGVMLIGVRVLADKRIVQVIFAEIAVLLATIVYITCVKKRFWEGPEMIKALKKWYSDIGKWTNLIVLGIIVGVFACVLAGSYVREKLADRYNLQ